MYRLAFNDDLIQKVVSKELAAGFRFEFGISEKAYEVDKEELNIFCSSNEVLAGVEDDKELFDNLKLKLETMLREIEDSENEYTFDCFGEFLLYSILQQTSGCIEDMEDDDDYDFSWKCSVTNEEKTQVYNIFLEYFTEDNDEELSNEELQQMAKDMTDRVTYFPRMVDEPDNKEPMIDILFWDRDFLLYEDFGNIEMVTKIIRQNADALGCIEGGETEPISGSFKQGLHEAAE